MKLHSLLCVLALSLPSVVLAAGTEVAHPDPQAEPPARVALWVAPVGTLWSLLAVERVYVPVGISVPLTDHLEFAGEVTPGWFRSDDCSETFGCLFSGGAWVGAGLTVHTGGRGLNGIFVRPKLVLGYFNEGYDNAPRLAPTIEYSVGLDFGYQYTVGHVYIAAMFGVRFALAPNGPSYLSTPVFPIGDASARTFFGFNANLLHIGAAF